jgi:hypothetical protein
MGELGLSEDVILEGNGIRFGRKHVFSRVK